MEPWRTPSIPTLPGHGSGRMPRVHDTSTGSLIEVGSPRRASMYVCGITPYDATHLGHAATYVAFDLLNRAWRDAGAPVHYVQNVTDVDDPLLERAAVTGEPWNDLASREVELFREDMAALRVIPPEHYAGVVESLPQIIGLIDRLSEAGVVYEIDGDLYFSVAAAPHFGVVSRADYATMLDLFAERGGDPDRAGKKHPLDALLWRHQSDGEPGWDSPFGCGRPGWHAECAAIALHYLGLPVDVQGGGSDLVFPHHEMSTAQATSVTGATFARAYVHAGMVGYAGAKMSKSRGNLVFVSKLRGGGTDPMALRLALLTHHYRSDWEWTPGDLAAAEERLLRWRSATAARSAASGEAVLATLRERLADDLDAPGAVAAVDAWVATVEASASGSSTGGNAEDAEDADAPGLVRAAVDALLGVEL